MWVDSLSIFTRSSKSSTLICVDAPQRMCSWKKQADRLFQLDPACPEREPQIDLLTETLEPMN